MEITNKPVSSSQCKKLHGLVFQLYYLYLKISYSGYVDNKLNHEPHLKNLHIQSSQVATNIVYYKKGELEAVGFLRALQNKRYKVTL